MDSGNCKARLTDRVDLFLPWAKYEIQETLEISRSFQECVGEQGPGPAPNLTRLPGSLVIGEHPDPPGTCREDLKKMVGEGYLSKDERHRSSSLHAFAF